MKNFYFFILIALVGSPVVLAQEVEFGAKAGVNFANIVGDDADGDMRTAFHLGLVAEISFAEQFYFGPEILYSSQGSKEEFTMEGFDFEIETKLDYIQIPLMVKYYITEEFNVEAGPQIGFLVNSEAEMGDETEDLSDYTSGFEYGLNFGVGYKLYNGLFFQGRYNLGLANI